MRAFVFDCVHRYAAVPRVVQAAESSFRLIVCASDIEKGMVISMKKIVVEETTYAPYGKCVRVSNGETELFATTEIGPRIIRFGAVGGPNMFFEDLEGISRKDDPEFSFFGEGAFWHIYGGHRLWAAPEALPRTYLPENEPVKYTLLENGVRLVPKAQRLLGTQNAMEVAMDADGSVTVLHSITNIGAWPVRLAPWAITVLAPGGMELVPQPVRDTGFLGNRLLAVWPYSDMEDPRVTWNNKYIRLTTDPSRNQAFKFGINSEHGFALYFNHNSVFVKHFDLVENGTYPDGGMNFETYTDQFLEMESLGEYKELAPGQTAEHREYWKLIPNAPMPKTAQEAEEAAEKYAK